MESVEAEKFPQKETAEIDIEDYDEAKETIAEAIKNGELPIISVPEEFAQAVKEGIAPNATWIGEKIIAGTILREPYLPEKENRKIFRINIESDQVEPRFTGPDKHFHGVIVFKGPIPPDFIEEVLSSS